MSITWALLSKKIGHILHLIYPLDCCSTQENLEHKVNVKQHRSLDSGKVSLLPEYDKSSLKMMCSNWRKRLALIIHKDDGLIE